MLTLNPVPAPGLTRPTSSTIEHLLLMAEEYSRVVKHCLLYDMVDHEEESVAVDEVPPRKI
jgi:hypothetical protein